jgi:hypothetical protein
MILAMRRDPGAPDLSVIIPVKLDARVVPTIRRLRAFARTRALALEIFVCGALPAEILADLAAAFLPVCPARKGACVRAGILAATAPVLLVCDADLPVSDTDLERVLAASIASHVVFASRTSASTPVTGTSRFRMGLSYAYRFLISTLLGLHLDTQCGVKVYHRETARLLIALQRLDGLLYDTELALNCRSLAIAINEVPVAIHNDRNSVINAFDAGIEVVIGLALLWLRRERFSRS